MTHPIKAPKKLIEVALPLDAINTAAAKEKSIRHGHPSTLHLWWARRPLAAARAVIFSQLVNDPSWRWELEHPGEVAPNHLRASWAASRKRLFKIIEDLVKWENTTNEEVLEPARKEIRKSWVEVCELNKDHPEAETLFNPEKMPGLHDPFAGGGTIPLEAQRLGLEAFASDLNPVAVLINKAMIEIPPKFAGRPPVHPDAQATVQLRNWKGAEGLAEDVRRYGAWMREEAQKKIGHLYPPVTITPEMAQDRPDLKGLIGQKLTVIAWLWARTVKSPHPAFSHVDVPLATTFVLSSKEGKESYVEPVVEGDTYWFKIRRGTPPSCLNGGTTAGKRAAFLCLLSNTPIDYNYIRSEGKAGRIGQKLMAVVCEGGNSRIYLHPQKDMELIAACESPAWKPDMVLPDNPRDFKTPNYGINTFGDLFTPRQLVALTTFSDLVGAARERIEQDFLAANPPSKFMSEKLWVPTPVPDGLLTAARALRADMTDAEQVLWGLLRGKHLDGFRFRRQHPIERYVLDFYCPSARLAIEVDGSQHFTSEGMAADAERTAWLESQGIRVIRFSNGEVLGEKEAVLETVWHALHGGETPPPQPSPGDTPPPQPSPAGGGSKTPAAERDPVPPPSGGRLGGGSIPLSDGGTGAKAYAEAVGVYLGFAISRSVDRGSSLCSWDSSPKMEALRNTFGRQALPMVWDFAEGNHFSKSSGNWMNNIEWASKSIESFCPYSAGVSRQIDAQKQELGCERFVSTDPPYYDNIGYADLSDFFYVWLRRTLRDTFPALFSTMAVPKAEELVATPYRHGSKEKAETFFLTGMTKAMSRLTEQAHPSAPLTIYYAFKQSETKGDTGTSSTGWETFLQAVSDAGLALTGTWPMRTELGNRMIGSGTNALASSIILVCRKRSADAKPTSRRAFIRELHQVLPQALDVMLTGSGDERSPVAPVDLSQAIIGPGMAVYSKYSAVLEADGTPMPVKTALQLINRFLAESDFDADTQFCTHWFETYGWNEGPFGEADVLSRAKGTGVNALEAAGVVKAGGGKVRILRWTEYPDDWDPKKDARLADWEILHHLIRIHRQDGDTGAGKILKQVAARTEAVRLLAFRLYTLCERKGWAEDARAYNGLATSWEGIEGEANAAPDLKGQMDLFGGKK